jgi:hypothetical protein
VGYYADILGTLRSAFRVNKATLDASGLTVARSFTFPDQSGTLALTGGSSPIFGTATLDFGSAPDDEVILTVLNSAVTSTSFITLIRDPAGTADHESDEHAIEEFMLTAQNLVVGVSFDIRMTCLDRFGLTGQWSIRWSLIG